MSDSQKINDATEVAFGALVQAAKLRGIPVGPVMGLMYLPTADLTRQFQEACRAVLDALKP